MIAFQTALAAVIVLAAYWLLSDDDRDPDLLRRHH